MKILKPWQELPGRAISLSVGITVLSLVYFMIIPLLALYLSVKLHTPSVRIGMVLAVLAVSNQGLQFVVGIISDRLGIKLILSLGIVVACLGFVGFALRPAFDAEMLCAFAVGLGTAATSVLGKALLVQMAGERRMSALAIRAAAVNGGAAVGPVFGALLFNMFPTALLATAAVYVAFWLILVRRMPGRSARPQLEQPAKQSTMECLFANGALVGLALVSIGYWFMYTQLTFTFPLYAHDRFALSGHVSFLFTLEAVIAVFVQYPAIKWLSCHVGPWVILMIGCGILAAAFLALATIPYAWALIVFIVLFALGALLMGPTLDVLATSLSPDSKTAGSLGVASLGWAVGGLLGNLAGGAGYEAASLAGRFNTFWFFVAVVGAATSAAFGLLRRRYVRSPILDMST